MNHTREPVSQPDGPPFLALYLNGLSQLGALVDELLSLLGSLVAQLLQLLFLLSHLGGQGQALVLALSVARVLVRAITAVFGQGSTSCE